MLLVWTFVLCQFDEQPGYYISDSTYTRTSYFGWRLIENGIDQGSCLRICRSAQLTTRSAILTARAYCDFVTGDESPG